MPSTHQGDVKPVAIAGYHAHLISLHLCRSVIHCRYRLASVIDNRMKTAHRAVIALFVAPIALITGRAEAQHCPTS